MVPGNLIYRYKNRASNRLQIPCDEAAFYYLERPSEHLQLAPHPELITLYIVAQDVHGYCRQLRLKYRDAEYATVNPTRPLSHDEIQQCAYKLFGSSCRLHWMDPDEMKTVAHTLSTRALVARPQLAPLSTTPSMHYRPSSAVKPDKLLVTNDGGGLGDQVCVWLATQMFLRAGIDAIPDYGRFKKYFIDAMDVTVEQWTSPKQQEGNDGNLNVACVGSITFPWIRSGKIPTSVYYSQLYTTQDYHRRYLMIELSGMHRMEYFARSFRLDPDLASYFKFRETHGKTIVVHTDAGQSERTWPNLDLAQLKKAFDAPVHEVKGILSVAQFKRLAREASIFVGTDSGVYNYMTYLGVKRTIMLAGPSCRVTAWPWSKVIHRSQCPPCWWRGHGGGCPNNICMSAITTEDVIDAIKEML